MDHARSSLDHGSTWWAALDADRIELEVPASRYLELTVLAEDADTPEMDIIEKDIGRTFPEYEEYRRMEPQLRRVLRAYAVRNTYCQGMSFIAATLLQHFSEPRAFCALAVIVEDFLPGTIPLPNACPTPAQPQHPPHTLPTPSLHPPTLSLHPPYTLPTPSLHAPCTPLHPDPTTPPLPAGYFDDDLHGAYMDQQITFSTFLPWRLPRLAAHFAALDFPMSIVGLRWYLCLYSADLSPASTCRLWDVSLTLRPHLFGTTAPFPPLTFTLIALPHLSPH